MPIEVNFLVDRCDDVHGLVSTNISFFNTLLLLSGKMSEISSNIFLKADYKQYYMHETQSIYAQKASNVVEIEITKLNAQYKKL